MLAETVWKQIGKLGLTVPDRSLVEAVKDQAAGLDDAALGRQLFILAAAARERGLDPEGALRRMADTVVHDVEDANRQA